MKNFLIIIVLTLFCTLSFGQRNSKAEKTNWPEKGNIEFGLLTGFSVNFFQEPTIDFPEYTAGLSYLGGLQLDYFFHRNWSLKTRVNLERRYYNNFANDHYVVSQFMGSWHFGSSKLWYLHLGSGFSLSLGDNLSNSLSTNIGIGRQFDLGNSKVFLELDLLSEATTSSLTFTDFNGNPVGETEVGGNRIGFIFGYIF